MFFVYLYLANDRMIFLQYAFSTFQLARAK